MITGGFEVAPSQALCLWQTDEPNGIWATIAIYANTDSIHVAISSRSTAGLGDYNFDLPKGYTWSATSRNFYKLQVTLIGSTPVQGSYVIEVVPPPWY